MPGYEQDNMYGRRQGMTPRNPGIVDTFMRALDAKQAKANIANTKANTGLLGAEAAYRRAGIRLTDTNIPFIRSQTRNMDADSEYKGEAAKAQRQMNERMGYQLEHYPNILTMFVNAINMYKQEPEQFMKLMSGFGNPGTGR